ncbi:hypothetical protein LWI28_015097 [Acer negundo]|uniref:F-box domain-containing protein n=1 Tax=Acer negundo TaxID=4023 RepID=A0AAD5NUP5_ACENE|nr:hypothetical protein LWI28_015097 [Acer negundo]
MNLLQRLLLGCSSLVKLLLWRSKIKKKDHHDGVKQVFDDRDRCCCCRWDQLPTDISETIVDRLSSDIDCVRLSMVCKSWRSSVKNRTRTRTRLPWLLLPPQDTKHLKFFDFSAGSFCNFTLPKSLQGGKFCASSKGWLIIDKGPRFNPILFLYNPISGARFRLPSLKTIPSFQEYIREFKDVYNITSYVDKIELSSPDVSSKNCVVAATFFNQGTFALCRPEDKMWSIFRGLDKNNSYPDILFFNGVLYALMFSENLDITFTTHNIRVGDGDGDRDDDVVLKLIPHGISLRAEAGSCFTLNHPIDWIPLDQYETCWIAEKSILKSYLVESNGELLIIHKILNDICVIIGGDEDEDGVGNGNEDYEFGENNNHEHDHHHHDDDEHDHNEGNSDSDDNDYVDHFQVTQLSKFEIFRIGDPNSSDIDHVATRLHSLDNRTLFVAERGSISIPLTSLDDGLKRNCIFFLDDSSHHNLSRDSGVFYIEDGRIERSFPFRWDDRTKFCMMTWFSPNIW